MASPVSGRVPPLRQYVPGYLVSRYQFVNELNHQYRLVPRTHEVHDVQFRSFELANSHAIDESPLLRRLVEDCETDDVVYDVGANIGTYSLVLGKQVSDGQVIAFEPVPSTYRRLTANVAEGTRENSVQTFNLALSSESGSDEIFTDVEDRYSTLSDERAENEGLRERVAIRKRRLDELAVPEPDRLKIDTEGHELEVLRGASGTVESARPTVYLEPHEGGGYERTEVRDFLTERSYRVEPTDGFLIGHPD